MRRARLFDMFTRFVVVHHLHHLVLQLCLRVGVLLTELLEDELLGERSCDGEPEELLQDQWLVLGTAHPPLFQVPPVRVLQQRFSELHTSCQIGMKLS